MNTRTRFLSAAIVVLGLGLGVMPLQAAENKPAQNNSNTVTQSSEKPVMTQAEQQAFNKDRKAALDKMTPAQRMAIYLQTLPEAERAAKFKAYSESEAKNRIQAEVLKYYKARGITPPASVTQGTAAEGGVTWDSAWAALTNSGKSPQGMRNRWVQLNEAQRLVILKGIKDKWASLSEPERQQMKIIIDAEKKKMATKQ